MIASGLTYPDDSTLQDVRRIVDTYHLKLDEKVEKVLYSSQPCQDIRVENHVVGSVEELCRAVAVHARELGYTPIFSPRPYSVRPERPEDGSRL